MFSTNESLQKKTGSEGVDRYEFLKLLTQEYYKTTSHDSKKQVLANLANFCYDPINYEFIRQLHIIDVFLNQLLEDDEDLLNFAVAALCNLSSDPENQRYIIEKKGIEKVSKFLSLKNTEIAANALTTLIYLISEDTKQEITSPEVIAKVLEYKNSDSTILRNLGKVFLEDYCTPHKIEEARRLGRSYPATSCSTYPKQK